MRESMFLALFYRGCNPMKALDGYHIQINPHFTLQSYNTFVVFKTGRSRFVIPNRLMLSFYKLLPYT